MASRSILPYHTTTSRQSILRLARDLGQRSDVLRPTSLLKDLNLALVSVDDVTPDNLFCSAARGLGARISVIRPSLTEHSHPQEIRHTARILGKLYSALEWPGIPAGLQEQLEREAAIPVFDGISLSHHPLARLAEHIDIDASADAKRQLAIQAVLLLTLQ